MAKKKKKTIVVESGQLSADIAEGREIMALVDSQKKAEGIADSLNIEFIEFNQGIAVYHTKENPSDVVKRGRSMGYDICINHVTPLIVPIKTTIFE